MNAGGEVAPHKLLEFRGSCSVFGKFFEVSDEDVPL